MAGPSDIRESFPTTEPFGGGAGVPLTNVNPGSAATGVNGSVGFAFQDVNGNVVLPQLNNLGQIPVTLDTSGQRLRSFGRVAGVLLTAPSSGDYTGWTQVLSISAATGQSLGDFSGKVSCRRGAIFEMVYQDSAATAVLDSTIVDAGQYTAPLGLGPAEDTFVVPASAVTPAIIVRAGNFAVISDLHATLAVTIF